MGLLRGEIVIADLEPTIGSEQRGIRPVLIIQNNTFNIYSPTTIIAPLSSKKPTKRYLTSIEVSKRDSGLNKDSTILLNQIRTIDKKRIVRKIGQLDSGIMKRVDSAIKVSLDLN